MGYNAYGGMQLGARSLPMKVQAISSMSTIWFHTFFLQINKSHLSYKIVYSHIFYIF